jgi:hypothetical protein
MASALGYCLPANAKSRFLARDLNKLAKLVVDIASGEAEDSEAIRS